MSEGIKLTLKENPQPVISRRSRSRSHSPKHKEPRHVSSIIRVRGLPYNSDASDVANFLTGIGVVSSVATIDPYGNPTGEFIVICQSEMDAREALTFVDRQIKRSVIVITESCKLAYDIEERNLVLEK